MRYRINSSLEHVQQCDSIFSSWLVSVVVMSYSPSRFVDVSQEQRDQLLQDALPAATRNATNFWLNNFKLFCSSSKEPVDNSCNLETVSEGELPDILERFYCSIWKKDGGEYK